MIFYRPPESVAADVIPFWRNGVFQLFYLRDFRDLPRKGEGTPWELLETQDFVTFTDRGEMIPRGGEAEQDLYIFTGSVFELDGVTYLFYTGHNPHLMEKGKPQEAICLAKSDGKGGFVKQPEFRLYATEAFEPDDFRDPFVFLNPETGEYNMLLAARLRSGPSRRRGCTAVATSRDLLHWQVQERPFYGPNCYFTHECPDLFQMGDWWYLLFSEFSDRHSTRYRMSKSPSGPWYTPPVDTFDNRAFYAAKSYSDGQRRFLFGWNPTREGDRDYAPWQWGGNIVVHELRQHPDGTLAVDVPETVAAQFARQLPLISSQPIGAVGHIGEGYTLGDSGGYNSIDLGELEGTCCIELDFTMDEDVREFSVFLRSDSANERSYYLKMDPVMGRLVFDRWPRPRPDTPFMLELERPARLESGASHHLRVLIDGPIVEAYLDHSVALSARMLDFDSGNFGLASFCGTVRVTRIAYTGV